MKIPLPPPELMTRVGGVVGAEYEEWGQVARRDILALLPYSLDGKRVLDFGCGAGRILRHLGEARLAACDIDAQSIEWVQANMPEVDAFIVTEDPAIPRPDESYDLVIAASVFTHIAATWLAGSGRSTASLRLTGCSLRRFSGPEWQLISGRRTG